LFSTEISSVNYRTNMSVILFCVTDAEFNSTGKK